jgi:hypothetical protein
MIHHTSNHHLFQFHTTSCDPLGSQDEAKSGRLRSASETAPLPLDERYPLVSASSAGLAEAAMSSGAAGCDHGAPVLIGPVLRSLASSAAGGSGRR